MTTKVTTLEKEDEIVMIRWKELYRYWFYHPVKTVKLFLKGMKRGYKKEFKNE